MTPALLRDVGEALYGSQWQTGLARDLGVAERTVRRWKTGKSRMPEGLWDDIGTLLNERVQIMEALTVRLR